MREYKVVVLGGGGVGKSADLIISAISCRFVNDHFIETYEATIEDNYRTAREINGEMCKLDILDTAGQEEFSALRDSYYRHGQGFIIVYSVINRSSFEEAVKLREHILRVKEQHTIPIVLVGNKCDLANSREVEQVEGNQLANLWNSPFIETSAKLRLNVERVFELIVQEIGSASKLAPAEITKTKNSKKNSGCNLL